MSSSHNMANLPYQIYAQAFYSHHQLYLNFSSTETSKYWYHLGWQKLDGTFSLYPPWRRIFLGGILWEQNFTKLLSKFRPGSKFWFKHVSLSLSWWRPISYRNQSIDLQSKSMDWFLYDISLRHESVILGGCIEDYPGSTRFINI